MVKPSGFGEFPFGEDPFGRANWTRAAIYHAIPAEYRQRDQEQGDVLRRTFEALAKSMNPLVLSLDRFPLLRSPDDVPIDLLDNLARDFGITTDQELSNARRRGEVTHAVRWFLLKGRKKAYIIIGAIFGYLVTVDNVYAEDCDDPTLTHGEHKWLALYDEVPSDVIPTDFVIDDPLDIYPYRAWPYHCPSHSLCITIRRASLTAPINAFNTVLKIVQKMRDTVRPIHVDFACLAFIETFDLDWQVGVGMQLIVKLRSDVNVACYYDVIDADVISTDGCLQATIQPICTYLNTIDLPWSCHYDVTDADVMDTDYGAICPEIIPLLPWKGSSLLFEEEFVLFP